MQRFVVAVALVLAATAFVSPARTEAGSGDPQMREKERWGCTWASGGVVTMEYFERSEGSFTEWAGEGRVQRCQKRPGPRRFDVVLEVRHVVAGRTDPLLARTRYDVTVGKGGWIRFTSKRYGSRHLRFWALAVAGYDGLCHAPGGEVHPPTAEPVRARLVVRKRGQAKQLIVSSRPWPGDVCSAPG